MKYLMKSVSLRGMILAASVALLPLGAQASTITASLTGPTELSVGEAATFVLSWGDNGPGSWTHFSGNGNLLVNGTKVQSFTLTPEGGMLEFPLTPSAPGALHIAAKGSISYVEKKYEILYYHSYRYRCGLFRTCRGSNPVYGWKQYNRGTFTLDEQLKITVSAQPAPQGSPALTAVPLPAAAPLLGAGLGLLGMMGWRRRRAAAG